MGCVADEASDEGVEDMMRGGLDGWSFVEEIGVDGVSEVGRALPR